MMPGQRTYCPSTTGLSERGPGDECTGTCGDYPGWQWKMGEKQGNAEKLRACNRSPQSRADYGRCVGSGNQIPDGVPFFNGKLEEIPGRSGFSDEAFPSVHENKHRARTEKQYESPRHRGSDSVHTGSAGQHPGAGGKFEEQYGAEFSAGAELRKPG